MADGPAMTRFAISRWLFLRMLGLVYFCAFASLAPQIVGLAGAKGIVPAGVSDSVLRAVPIAGAAVSLALAAGVMPMLLVPLLWAAYLWLSNAAGLFLSYQWDALLLEAGFLAVLLAPAALRDRLRDRRDAPNIAIGLMLWLAFRLMFGSGGVKLASGDPTWRDLTAMTFHYETQPLPNPVAFYAHHLPAAFNKASTAITVAIELFAPWTMLTVFTGVTSQTVTANVRLVSALLLVGLQVLIALTGNFAFFNLLSIALCLFFVDDETWTRVAQRFMPANSQVAQGCRRADSRVAPGDRKVAPGFGPAMVGRYAAMVVAVVTVPVSLLYFTSSLGFLVPGEELAAPVAQLIAPLRSVNSYGLFAVMTTTRPEIVVEGSNDGARWTAYEFKDKPGDLTRRPPVVAPHQPRLDWQMWFAALGRYEENPWFANFCGRLLEGSPDVLRLLAFDPFGGHPPRFVRAMLYQYRFADMATHRATGVWWTRERLGSYSPVLTLTHTP
jgi:lipase maturation factor 1